MFSCNLNHLHQTEVNTAMSRLIVVIATVVLFSSTGVFAQAGSASSTSDVAFWVDHGSLPPVILFGEEQETFNKNMQTILFPWNDHDEPSNPSAMDSNAEWLKAHPSVRFYIDGYASTRGDDIIYNLNLSQRRANWVKQVLVSRGIAENRIKLAVGWGQLYPVCAEENDECWSKNRLVRFQYAPD